MNEWINVKDRLPTVKEHGKYFLCRCILDGDNNEKNAYYVVLRWYIYDVLDSGTYIRPHFENDGCNGMSVTHWMPLPEPPKED